MISLQQLTRLAESGNADAQYDLGLYYLYGEGAQKDVAKGAFWTLKAAEQGLVDAQTMAAALYYDGTGVPESKERSIYWHYRAAQQGDVSSMAFVGIAYSIGEGVDKDDAKAVEFLIPAARQGNKFAQENLADLYLEGRGVERDIEQAVHWYQKAAEQGSESARKRAEALMEWERNREATRSAHEYLAEFDRNGGTAEAFWQIVDSCYRGRLRAVGFTQLLDAMPTTVAAVRNIENLWGDYNQRTWNEMEYTVCDAFGMGLQVAAAHRLMRANKLSADGFVFSDLLGGTVAMANDRSEWCLQLGFGFRYTEGRRSCDFGSGEWVRSSTLLEPSNLDAYLKELTKIAEKELIGMLTYKAPTIPLADVKPVMDRYSHGRLEDIHTNRAGQNQSVLVNAAAHGYCGVLQTELANGVNVQEKEYNGTTALEAAAYFGHAEAVDLLLRAGAKVNYRSDYHLETPLMMAALQDQEDIALTLLQHGAQVDYIGDYGSALHYAVSANHKEMVKVLIKHKANVNAMDSQGYTAMHIAAYKGFANVLQLLLKAGGIVRMKAQGMYTPLLLAVAKGRVNCTRALLEKNADPNDALPSGKTALMMAAELQNEEMVRILLGQGAASGVRDSEGRDAMHYANKNEAIATLLYYAGT
ncbi:ankyrin repeat domain-containing protein [Cohnella thailandensis]|uniref:Ankyrin repeat domain-containing protein n=1 Tax=Cohnella thailandensis TaxID=557557 RepID=A0A841T3Q5_9BACL|nr:ankyrin repeat domain-containing protein [Cohnella thailandensis]MBB6637629.1 ankyrin repeat domain-containing protein [Cohnella thailandensis]MBP1974195.1 ankyrin repeat protein/TPR repeat protein [Cohnella thailandensis]